MSLDDRLRADLGTLDVDPALSIDACLDAVSAGGRQRRRRRALARQAGVVMAVAMIVGIGALVVGRSHDTVLDVVGPESSLAPVASTTASPRSSTVVAPTSATPTSVVPPTVTSATTTTSALGPGVPVDLRFTGRYEGYVTAASVAGDGLILGPHTGVDSGRPACPQIGAHDEAGVTIGVEGLLGGRPFVLGYSVGDVHNPVRGLHEGEVIIGHDPLTWDDALSFDPLRVVVDPDRLGGAIDADLVGPDQRVAGHVSGHFRCAAAGTTPLATTPTPFVLCAADQVDVRLDTGGAAAGHQYQVIVFTNRSETPCTIVGTPGVEYQGADGIRSGPAAHPDDQLAPPVTLTPGGAAHALLDDQATGNLGTAQCGPIVPGARLAIFVPGLMDPVTFDQSVELCTNDVHQLIVGPTRPGGTRTDGDL
jgi:hypothetical protein